MKKLLYILLFLLPTLGFSQSGDGYVNYTSYRTQCNAGCVFSRTVNGTSVTVSGYIGSTSEFDAAMTIQSNSNAVYVMNSGEALAKSNKGFGTSISSTIGGRPTGQTQGEYYIVDYTGWFYASSTGNYKFHTWSDDAHEFYLDLDGDDVLESTELITKKYGGAGNNQSSNISLTSGTWYKLRVRFHEYGGNDWLRVQYQDPTNNGSSNWRIVGDGSWGDKVSNSEPTTTPSPEVDLDLEFNSQMAPEQFRFRVYYDGTSAQTGTEWLNTSTMNSSYYLDDDGSKDITDYINTLKMADGKKGTTVGGSVEWCVIYDYDNTNKRHRILIDKREFPSGVSVSDVKKLQLFDLWDGDVTYYTDDAYWAQYYIYTDESFDFSNSTYSSYLRDAGSYYGTKAEFTFVDNEIYKGHKVTFMNPSNNIEQWTAGEFMDDYITVADVVAGFSELAGGGINGGFKGDLNGVQLQNADINGDKNFDFQDTQIGLNFLQGNDIGFNGYLSEIMRIVPKSEYDGTTTSNWSTQTTYSPSTSILFSIKDTLQTLEYKVSFLGDVNLSHSAPQTTQTTSAARLPLSRQNNTSLEVGLDIEKTEEHIIITLDVPENNFNLVGSEFRIGFDNERVEYDKLETTTMMNSFDAKRSSYIKVGSISVDGSMNLNGGVQYKIYFKPIQSFDSTLGLVSVKKSEVVDKNANTINVIIK